MNWLIIVAGGSGSRMKSSINKIFININQKPLLYWTLLPFQQSKNINQIIISAKPKEYRGIQKIVDKYKFSKVVGLSSSGQLRQDTVFNALKFIKNKTKKNDIIGVHNAANPFVSQDEIKSVFQAAKKYKSALLAYPSPDTIKIVNKDAFVFQSPNRESCFCAQTPQVARFDILYSSYQKVFLKKIITTDDSQVVELNGYKPKIISCSSENFKITYPKDLILAKEILKVKYNL